jgi:hypothetical protein
MGREEARIMLAYPVRQQVTWWLQKWGNVEIAVAVFFWLFLAMATREGKITLGIALIPLATAIGQRFFLVRQLVYLGALMDFVSPNRVMAERGQLEALRLGMLLVEVFKLVMGGVVAVLLIGRRHRRSGLTRQEVDAIDKSDDSHVNR